MTRILVLGDSAGTGFGTVTADLGRGLLGLGHELRFVSLNEQTTEDLPEPFADRMLQMGNRDGWLGSVSDSEYKRLRTLLDSGEGLEPEDRIVMEGYASAYVTMRKVLTGAGDSLGWRPEAAIVIGDAGALDLSRITTFLDGSIPAFHYVPIEGEGIPPRWATYWQHLQPVAMTEFGARQIATITGQVPPFVYHGVDHMAFWPVSALRPILIDLGNGRSLRLESKADCKRFVAGAAAHLSGGLHQPNPERLWVLRADRHMPRKMYSSLFRIVGTVLSRFPNAEFLYHCRTQDQGGNLDDDRSKWPADIHRRMMPTGFHDGYGRGGANRDALNAIYNSADVYVSTSAEGFGLTVAEAMACGVPVVGLDYAAVPEVIGDAGLLVPVGGLVDNIYGHFWARPDEAEFVSAITKLLLSRGMRRDLGMKATERVRAICQWSTAAQAFTDLIAVPQEAAA